MRNSLIIFDVDDTLFFANQLIGMEVDGEMRWITQQEFHEHDVAGTIHPNLDFSKLLCSKDFVKNLKPNPIMIERLKNAIKRDQDQIVIMTARHVMSDVPLFISAFHKHGVDTKGIEFIFAGSGGEIHWPSHQKKAVFFDRFLAEGYDKITLYDDNTKFLDYALQAHLDFPFTTVRTFRIDSEGKINNYNGC